MCKNIYRIYTHTQIIYITYKIKTINKSLPSVVFTLFAGFWGTYKNMKMESLILHVLARTFSDLSRNKNINNDLYWV